MKISKDLYKEIADFDLDYIEILALLGGIKPLIFCAARQAQKNGLIKLMKKLNLCYRFVANPVIEKKTEMSDSDGVFLAIAKDAKKIKDYIRLYFGDDFLRYIKAGELLGYPKCCSSKYINYVSVDQSSQRLRNYYYQAVKKSKRFHPFLNSFFTFYGRINKEELIKLRFFYTKNQFLNMKELMLISHVPCSFDCPQSIDYAEKVHFLLKKEDQNKVDKIIEILSKPLLFFDTFKFIVFNGQANAREIVYRDIGRPFSLVTGDIMGKISQGDRLSVNSDEIKIYKAKKKIDIIKKEDGADGFIVPFQKV